MKTKKKLLSFLLALAMSLYALPTVWAEEITRQPQDIHGNSYTDMSETDLPAVEEDINTDNGTVDTSPAEDINADITVTEPPKNEEDSAVTGDGVSVMSLLPMETEMVDVLIDRRMGTPPEIGGLQLFSFFTREALQEILGEEYNGVIMYSSNNSDYREVGWNDIITPPHAYSKADSKYGYVSYYVYAYFILSNDQLDPGEKRYCITVNFKYPEDFIGDLTLDFFNDAGETFKAYYSHISANYNPDHLPTWSAYSYISNVEYGNESKDLYFLITFPEGYSKDNVEIYEGIIHNEAELGSSENIISKITNDGTAKAPYKMEISNDYILSDSRLHWEKKLTYVITTENGSKVFLPITHSVHANFNHITIETLSDAPHQYCISDLHTSPNSDHVYAFNEKVYEASNFDSIRTNVLAYYYDYSDKDSNGYGQADASKIDFACFGNYGSKEDAVQAGEADIKDSLFSYRGVPVDLSKCSDVTVYLDDGTKAKAKAIEVTAVDIYGVVFHTTDYLAITGKINNNYFSLSNDTYFNINGAQKNSDNERKTYLNSYKISSSDDSYYSNGYQTFLLLDNGQPVAENVIYPTFTNSTGARIYIGNNVAEESESTPRQTSGESPLAFVSGRAVQYSAASESGTHLKNYWVTFVTQQRGPKLFVNATNNPDHYSNGKPQRVVYLNSKYSYHHDIFFANIGDEELTGINVSLSNNAQGVKLDDYWTVIDSSVKKLSPFTKTSSPDNIAKVRLVPVDEDKFGTISGTLTISAANGDSVDIDLTGVAGVPKIVTDNLYDGVKYVPYSCVIMTNSMDDSGAMKFSVSSGALPSGMVLRPNGELYGVPTEAGSFTFTVRAEYNGAKQEDGSLYSCSRTYSLVINDNTDENVDAVNGDIQGYPLTEKVSKNITVYYSSENNGIPVIEKIEMDNDLFRSEGSYSDEFLAFYIDGIPLVENTDYTAEEGSTKITVRDQTFGHIIMTDSDVPHTLAAEFRTDGKTKDLKRSAQNVYLNYVHVDAPDVPDSPDDPNDPDKPDNTDKPINRPTVSIPSGSTNDRTANTYDNNNMSGSVNTTMIIVDTVGNPLADISLELHSTAMYAKTDNNGTAKFDSVEFGRHKLYINDPATNKRISKSFTIVSGTDTNIKGNVITAANGEKISLKVEFDGKKLKFLSVFTDVSAEAGIISDSNIVWIGDSKALLSEKAAIIFIVSALAASFALIIVRKHQKRQ